MQFDEATLNGLARELRAMAQGIMIPPDRLRVRQAADALELLAVALEVCGRTARVSPGSQLCGLPDDAKEVLARAGLDGKPRVITSYVHPPIGDRRSDWQAHRDGQEENGHYGSGRTEAEAIAQLLEMEDEA